MDKLYWFTNNEGDNITINCDSDIVGFAYTIYHWYDGTDFRTGKRTFRERISYGSESI